MPLRLSRRAFARNAAAAAAAVFAGPACAALPETEPEIPAFRDEDFLPVSIGEVIESKRGEYGVVLLKDASNRYLPIWVGKFEAQSIRNGWKGFATPRPMTYDFLRNVLDAAGTAVERVMVTQLRDMTFYARLVLKTNGKTRVLDSRPSDALALAVRTNTPVFAARALMDAASVSDEEIDALEATHLV